MIKFGFYRKPWKKIVIWRKKMDKYLPGSVVPCYGCFIRGQILNSNGEWEDIVITSKEPYDLKKQYRKSKEKFLISAYYKGWDPSANSRVAFDTLEEAQEYYRSHRKIEYKRFRQLVECYQARYVKARMYSIIYKGGIGYVAV